MDLTKAQRLLNKIQAFLDNGNAQELSRLEKDLIKSYIQQLYDLVAHDEEHSQQETTKHVDTSTHKLHKEEPSPKQETPVIHISDNTKSETTKTTYSDYTPPPVKKTEVEMPVYSEYITPIKKEEIYEAPELKDDIYEAPKQKEEKIPEEELKYTPSYYAEPVKETIQSKTTSSSSSDAQEALQQLFDMQKSEDASVRFGHVPIPSIESAMGLNERIFTLNELFGGDKVLFDAWCTRLNNLNSFAEARNVLISGPAKDFKWADPQRLKMAEQFIRIVHRRYPKTVS